MSFNKYKTLCFVEIEEVTHQPVPNKQVHSVHCRTLPPAGSRDEVWPHPRGRLCQEDEAEEREVAESSLASRLVKVLHLL